MFCVFLLSLIYKYLYVMLLKKIEHYITFLVMVVSEVFTGLFYYYTLINLN